MGLPFVCFLSIVPVNVCDPCLIVGSQTVLAIPARECQPLLTVSVCFLVARVYAHALLYIFMHCPPVFALPRPANQLMTRQDLHFGIESEHHFLTFDPCGVPVSSATAPEPTVALFRQLMTTKICWRSIHHTNTASCFRMPRLTFECPPRFHISFSASAISNSCSVTTFASLCRPH